MLLLQEGDGDIVVSAGFQGQINKLLGLSLRIQALVLKDLFDILVADHVVESVRAEKKGGVGIVVEELLLDIRKLLVDANGIEEEVLLGMVLALRLRDPAGIDEELDIGLVDRLMDKSFFRGIGIAAGIPDREDVSSVLEDEGADGRRSHLLELVAGDGHLVDTMVYLLEVASCKMLSAEDGKTVMEGIERNGDRIDDHARGDFAFPMSADSVADKKQGSILASAAESGIFVVLPSLADIALAGDACLVIVCFHCFSPSAARRRHRCPTRIPSGWWT